MLKLHGIRNKTKKTQFVSSTHLSKEVGEGCGWMASTIPKWKAVKIEVYSKIFKRKKKLKCLVA